jgi:hypothetical protein
MFQILGTSDRFWNKKQFIDFLIKNQKQHIDLSIVPEAVCLKSLGVYDLLDMFEFESVTIQTWNPLETHDKYNIKLLGYNFWFDRIASINPILHDWDQSKIFMCLYHRPTASRLGIASYALKYNSLIHFSADTDPDSLLQFELDKLLEYDINSVARASNLICSLPILLSSKEKLTKSNGYDYADPLTNFYKSTLIDLVVESHVKGQTFFPTEKTIRPILLKKPFITFGSRDFLAYLRQMGFRTFADFWDEDYDGYEQGDRLKKIYQIIDNIATMNAKQLQTMYWDMQYTLEHNYNVLVNKKFKKSIIQI